MDSKSIHSRLSSPRICKHDVFLSFRGTDTRNTFADHLYNHLISKGIFAFKDDKSLEKGEPVSPQLLQAIKDSRLSIVVFSKDYAGSTWCLEEMATIADCEEELKQPVFSVFYDVDPSDVRKQSGVYENAFALLTEKFKQVPGKVDRWKRAMTGLAYSVNWDVRDKSKSMEIEKIVQKVIKTLNHKFSGFADDLIGIQPRVEGLEKLLKLSSEYDGFRVLGICERMGGIGKTTHATVLYDRISYQFDACCFIENISQIYRDGGATAVQKQILHQIADEKNLESYSPSEISWLVGYRLCRIKVLVVLDNVDELEQLKKLAINPGSLHTGSRMIITTRDEHILEDYGVDATHKVSLWNNNDARELFCRKAFKINSDDPSSNPSRSCVDLIPEILTYAQGIPLAIRAVGSLFCNRDATQWRATLDGLWNNPDKTITEVFQICFGGLRRSKRELFLHSGPSSRRICKYDVFLSFRGTDTRNNFTDHLYAHLIRKGIFTFKDDKTLEKGGPISPQLLHAIKDSRISIIVFSKDYAGSTWCLEEMATIADCEEELKQTVFSIFYDVDPSNVRTQSGVYENAFALLAEKFKEVPGKVDRWKRAMTGLANSVGWDVRDKPKFKEIV